jgi:hypothetical protein
VLLGSGLVWCAAAIVPAAEEVEIDVDFDFIDDFVVVIVNVVVDMVVVMIVMVVLFLFNLVFGTGTGLDFFQPLLLTGQADAFMESVVKASQVRQCSKCEGSAWWPLQLHHLVSGLA